MFKISKLILKTTKEDRVVELNNFTYIYGSHDKGKTVLLDLIDYMMGDSDYTFVGKHATKGIMAIEMELENSGSQLWLRREPKDCFYKLNSNDKEYIRVVGVAEYKNKILEFILNGNDSVLKEYKILTDGKNIGYRSLSLFNYLEESGVADITNVFPKSKEIGVLIDIKYIMLYIFNKQNVLKINRLKTENIRLEKELKRLKIANEGVLYCEKVIRDNMEKLSFDSKKSILVLKKQFEEYIGTTYVKEKESTNKDLVYLIKASQQLSEEIKYQKFLAEQSKHETSNLKSCNKLLALLSSIIVDNPENKDIVEKLRKEIEINGENIALLDVKDYIKSIENLQERKNNIDKQIGNINRGLDRISYKEKLKIINLLEDAFNRYYINNYAEKIELIEKQIKENNDTVKALEERFDERTKNLFDDLVTAIYKKFDMLDFVQADIKQSGFKLKFNPSKISVSAIVTEEDHDKNIIYKNYLPGSKARLTLWQLVTYMAMCVFLKSNFEGMPFAPYLAIDAVVQEFSDTKTDIRQIIKVIKNFAYENESQIVISGAVFYEELDLNIETEVVDINNGLNPAFSYHN